jgi:hypothetical protein
VDGGKLASKAQSRTGSRASNYVDDENIKAKPDRDRPVAIPIHTKPIHFFSTQVLATSEQQTKLPNTNQLQWITNNKFTMTKPTLDYHTKLAIIHMGGTIFDERRQATLLLGVTSKCHKNGWQH